MEPRRARGLILRLRGLGESDLLVDMFTRELGRVTALAKGGKRSRKRFFGLFLLGHYLDMQLAPPQKGSDLWRLETASLLASHLGLRQDFRRFLAAAPVWELLLRATAAQDPNPLGLDLALTTLARLERAADPPELASGLMIYLARLLVEMGYGLSLGACLICGKPGGQGESMRLSLAGGLVCQACLREINQGGDESCCDARAGLVKGLEAAQSLELAALQRLKFAAGLHRQGLAFLAEFWRKVAGRDLPSLDLAQSLLSNIL
ncbi:hypothetical protein AAU61_19910 [Desulfocarbo indianensis]|nr:hypothetical protein AAU61_19910 [Desulfocarbo indianensis]